MFMKLSSSRDASRLQSMFQKLQEPCEKLKAHMGDLETNYFDLRSKISPDSVIRGNSLSSFAHDLTNATKYTKVKTLAMLHYADNFFNYASSIVSSIQFDKDDEFFATAGVTKKIRVYEFEDVVKEFRASSNFITRPSPRFGSLNESENEAQQEVVEVANLGDEEDEDGATRDQVPRYALYEMSCNSKIRYLYFRLLFLHF